MKCLLPLLLRGLYLYLISYVITKLRIAITHFTFSLIQTKQGAESRRMKNEKSLKNSVKNKEKVSLVAWLDKKEKRREEKKQRAPVISRL
jgi:hypothetical protein